MAGLPTKRTSASSSEYARKIKDPRWQKKRLEALNLSGWSCESCGNERDTLHVHHKQYLKGRDPWEYDFRQLAVLCAECHAEAHATDDLLQVACSYAPMDGPLGRASSASVMFGFLGIGADAPDAQAQRAGVLARHLASWTREPLTGDEVSSLEAILEKDPGWLNRLIRSGLQGTGGSEDA